MSLVTALASAAPWRVRELGRLDAVVRRRHPLAVRVGVVGVVGGAGASVVAGMAASVLTTRGGNRVLLVDASGRRRSALWHSGVPSHHGAPTTPEAPEEDEGRVRARRFEQVVAGLPRSASGTYGMGLGDDAEARWWQTVAPITRFFDHTVTDWGTGGSGALGTVAASSTVVCVVAPAERSAIQHAVDVAATVREPGAAPVVCVTDPHRTSTPAISQMCDLLPFPTVRFAHDRAHGDASLAPGRRLGSATRLSALRLAAAIVEAAEPRRVSS
ncbi:MAG: hypothetical protein FWD18_09240 [Micrococcales bacterium]|nr:hypothetical protein [Micrococcales bacterium]